jgi:SAM-dependent methyltransferase
MGGHEMREATRDAATDPAVAVDHRAEEQFEIAKHAEVYRCDAASALVMEPDDWEKLDRARPLNAYFASMIRLGDVRGRHILDAGCGDGWLSVILAKRGARVTGFDLSPHAIQLARARIAANDVAACVHVEAASFYNLPFPDGAFDAAIGQAILHHIRDKRQAAVELHRVLRPGAYAYFVEAFRGSDVLERLRLLIPVASEAPEDPDHWKDKLTYADLAAFDGRFEVRAEEYQLLSRLGRVLHARWFVAGLNRLDRWLLRAFPFLRRYARTVLIELRRVP